MSIPSKQIGQSAEANLLWNISKQLNNLRKTSSIVDPALLAKIDELIAVSSEIEISAENINLNTDDLETLIEEGNALLEQIRDNTAAFLISNVSFYTALQDYDTYAKNDVLSRTDFYNQANGDLVFTKWYNATRESIVEVVGNETNLLLQGTEKDTPFSVTINDRDKVILNVVNIASLSAYTPEDITIEGSVDGTLYQPLPVLINFTNYISGTLINNANSSIDTSSISFVKLTNTSGSDITVGGFLSMLSINNNGAPVYDLQSSQVLSLQEVEKNTTEFYTENVEEDTATATTYVGKQSVEGQWIVQKIVDVVVGTITTTTLQYATVVNNSTITTYASAWSDRATLTYSEIKNLL